MKSNILSENFKTIHFIGAGGVSMSGLIKYLLLQGKTVTGSDLSSNGRISELKKLGVKIYSKHSALNVRRADAVVYTSAVSRDNPELKAAEKRKIPVFKRSELLGEVLKNFSRSVAVSGSHGKTTATAMIAKILIEAEKNPTVFLGGEDLSFGNFRRGNGEIVIAEACEYKRNFLDISPDIAVILNVDDDHMDAYKDMSAMTKAFKTFARQSLAVVNADDVYAREVFNSSTVTFGIERPAVYTAKRVKRNEKGYSFTPYVNGRKIGKINLSIAGRHNVYNALAAFAVADIMKISFTVIKKALENFSNVKRRNEFLGSVGGVSYYADYAHHPKELQSFISAAGESGEDFITVFQPHTYSRTKLLTEEFIGVLKNVKPLIIYKTYPAREKFDKDGSAEVLYEKLCAISEENRFFANSFEELKGIIEKISGKYTRVFFLGAGDIYDVAESLVKTKNKII